MAEEAKNYYGKRPLWQWIALYLVIAVILYGAFYYLFLAKKGGYNYNQTQAPTYQQSSPTVTQTQTNTETMKVTVEGSEFAFSPSTITAKKGQTVEVTFKNTGAYPHNLTIVGVAQSKTIQPGSEDTFSFTADKTGTFPFSCTVDSHADKGMTGTLTVE